MTIDMENTRDSIRLDYNTEREKLQMPEYGRNVIKMVEHLKEIEDRDKRTEQAYAVVKVMELAYNHTGGANATSPVRGDENYFQKFWDHLFIIAGDELDVDAPFPKPQPENRQEKPMRIPYKDKPVKAAHYGRNIESIIDLIEKEPDGEEKTELIRQLAFYMRQQYLIWNKDSVDDETILHDIEKLSDFKIHIPEGLEISKMNGDGNFARPALIIDGLKTPHKQQGGQRFNYKKKR